MRVLPGCSHEKIKRKQSEWNIRSYKKWKIQNLSQKIQEQFKEFKSDDSVFKGYLHYKTITPQHVLSEAKVKNFLFCGKIMLRSQDIQVFSYPTI